MRKDGASAPQLFTIGHSTRAIEDFVALLRHYGIAELIDVRTVPGSRHNPQFNRETLPQTLSAAGIAYRHMASLGGLRRAARDSVNGGWRQASFRGFADYMQTPEFEAAIAQLIERAKRQRTAIMCAEAVPWRCHRSLIADALVVRGVRVKDILARDREQPHRLTPFARVDGVRITYPGKRGDQNA